MKFLKTKTNNTILIMKKNANIEVTAAEADAIATMMIASVAYYIDAESFYGCGLTDETQQFILDRIKLQVQKMSKKVEKKYGIVNYHTSTNDIIDNFFE